MNTNAQIMAILNLTPDSFYDGGSYRNLSEILAKVEKYLQEGADIIDIGAYSSRSGAVHISSQEEQERLIPALKEIVNQFPKVKISIDTFRSEIAKICIEEGASIINDISGGEMDDTMYKTVAHYHVPYILMHMKGTPQNMQQNLTEGEITKEVKTYFQKKLELLSEFGLNDVILDVGFGFGKSIEQNYELLRNLNQFKSLQKPLLVGISRKSMLYKTLDSNPKEALNATTVAHTLALINGADYLRVHDVKEAKETITILKKYNGILN